MTVAISVAVGQGAEAVVCASTGNTSASMAAYAARAGMKPLVLVPQGKIAAGKLAQAIVHGAQVIMVRGNFDDCLRISRGLAEHYPVALVNSVNPMRLRGPEDGVLRDRRLPRRRARRARAAGRQRRQHLGVLDGLPRVRRQAGDATRLPVMRGWQAAGAAPLVLGCAGADPGDRRHRDPHRQPGVVGPRDRGAGRVRRQFRAGHRQRDPRRAARAGLPRRRLRRARLGGRRRRAPARGAPRASRYAGQQVVVTVTGHGLKDIDTALSTFTDLVDTVVRRRRRRGRRGRRPRLMAVDGRVRRRDRSPSRCRPPAPTSGPGFDASGSRSSSPTPGRRGRRRAARGRASTGEGAGDVPARRAHLVVRAMRAAFEAMGVHAAGTAAALHQPDPAQPRARLVLGRDRRRHRARAGAGRRRATRCSTTPRAARWPTGSRGTRTTSRRRCSAGS